MAAALGFRAHTGWAASVGVGVRDGVPYLVCRKRVEMITPEAGVPAEVYHAARRVGAEEGALLVERARQAARTAATEELRALVDSIEEAGWQVAAVGVLLGAARIPEDLGNTLASHALVHTAEGILYREALMEASRDCGVPAVGVLESEVWQRLADAVSLEIPVVEHRIAELRRAFGPPWAKDQKLAGAAAWLALVTHR